MKVHENIRFMRLYKDWTQELLANKLGISTLSYAKIERGETDINLSRLQQISEVMEIDLAQLFGLNEKMYFILPVTILLLAMIIILNIKIISVVL